MAGAGRAAGWVTAGAVLSLAAAVLHPPTFDPKDVAGLQAAVRAAPQVWVAVHAGFAAGVSLWTVGLLGLLAAVGPDRGGDPAAAPAVVAWALWLVALVFEAAGLPAVVGGPVLEGMRAAWPATLAAGYVAGALDFVALLVLAARLARRPGPLRTVAVVGLWLLPAGIVGQALAWFWPGRAPVVLLLTLGPGVAWSVVAAWAAARAAAGG